MAQEAPQTVFVRGSGGSIFEMDVPTKGMALERYEQALAKGDLTVVPFAHWVDGLDGARHLVADEAPAVEPAKPAPKGKPAAQSND